MLALLMLARKQHMHVQSGRYADVPHDRAVLGLKGCQ